MLLLYLFDCRLRAICAAKEESLNYLCADPRGNGARGSDCAYARGPFMLIAERIFSLKLTSRTGQSPPPPVTRSATEQK